MLDKTFDFTALEQSLYRKAEEAGAFKTNPESGKEPFCIIMPPPNVTGNLHIGHALTFTLQDILARFQRMRGKEVLLQAGTDHAGIATQMVVERQLQAEGQSRHTLGRENFLDKVWQWKRQSSDMILAQMQRLGISADWERSVFTLDEVPAAAVRKVFVQLYEQGLIYRGQRLVNWDVTLQTAISDVEVVNKETNGAYYTLRYPLADGSGAIEVATTRPETLFGDAAVAVHPSDERYLALIGKKVLLPLTGRTIPIIADEYSDPTKGTGAVKITPAHDFNDFAVGQRHGLPLHNILHKDGTLNDGVPPAFRGMDRLKARPVVVAALEEAGVLVKTDKVKHPVPHGDRSGSIIEPLLTEQWFVDSAPLASRALEAVKSGKTRFVPTQWQNTYFRWLEEIQPWCISRQLWWGHRIPAWYAGDGTIFVAENEENAQQQARAHFGEDVALAQDDDVLDTWFSSALWPMSTLGWPNEQSVFLKKFYPTSVLVTGFDIIFFWVARMMMMGLHVTGDVPFQQVYIHALVRDADGQKMSKSKGNVIDPLALVSQYGTDALRFTLTILAAAGRDVKLSLPRVEGYRNFVTKLWNAGRFLQMNDCTPKTQSVIKEPLNRWLLVRWNEALSAMTTALEEMRFNEAADALYSFGWHTFCDWYVECAKPLLAEGHPARTETQAVSAMVFGELLKAAHPIMPFVTDALAGAGGFGTAPLAVASWPKQYPIQSDTETSDIDALIQLVSHIRSARNEVGIPAGQQLMAVIVGASVPEWIEHNMASLCRLARLSTVSANPIPPASSLRVPFTGGVLCLPLEGVIDLAAEKARLLKEQQKATQELDSLKGRLENEAVMRGAPAEVVEEWQERQELLQQRSVALNAAILALGE